MAGGGPGRRLLPGSRLKRRADFLRTRNEGRRASRGCLIANWLVLPQDAASRVGVITSRKLGPSVVRSRARRLLRETFRLHQSEFQTPLDLVLIARSSIIGKKRQDVERDFLALFADFKLLKGTE